VPTALLLAAWSPAQATWAEDAAASPPRDDVTLERIMADPDWLGAFPEHPAWADDSQAVYFERKRPGANIRDLFRLPLAATGGEGLPSAERLADEARVESPGEGGAWSPAWSPGGRRRVFLRDGDVWLHDLDSGRLSQLTRTNDLESAVRFQADPRFIAYRRGTTWVVRDSVTGLAAEPADLRLAKDPAAPPDPDEPYVGRQEERLFTVLATQLDRERADRERDTELRAADPSRPPRPWYLGDDVELVDSELSPAGTTLLAVLSKKGNDDGKRDLMPRWVTRDGYVEQEAVRPKVGTGKATSPTLALLDLTGHRRFDLDLTALPGIDVDPLADLRQAAQAARDAEAAKATPVIAGAQPTATKAPPPTKKAKDGEPAAARDTPRAVDVQNLVWSPDGRHLLLDLRAADNKDRWLATVDATAEAPRLVPLQRLSDPAWINYAFQEVGWLPDSQAVWYLSEETGYAHLYLHPLHSPRRQLTRGNFEVASPIVTRDGRLAYVQANRDNPGVWEIYRLALPDAGTPPSATPPELVAVTALGGLNEAHLSPDERQLLVVHSEALRPPELWLQPLLAEAAAPTPARPLTDSRSAAFTAIQWTPPRFEAIPSTHTTAVGLPIHARVYTPEAAATARGLPAPSSAGRRPAVVFVHGAGYLQNAHQGWSDYAHEFMFHSLLTRRGYVVLDLDYRASAGYGRDWRTAIYRWMGKPELEDLADGVAWLVAHENVDPARIGVYGGSYGGFLTFMSMFTQPYLFAAGAALRPVTDWSHYNQGYTSDILNTPDVDPEAYRRSSPIEFAAGLRKPLLICHGMVDDNVLFLDSVRLVQRLIELEKGPLFETAIYPVEAHGFKEPSSWLDEYRRIYALFERTLWPPS
jgi:dipeptidyl aminopeptidase/acylaminoacyl peptidase